MKKTTRKTNIKNIKKPSAKKNPAQDDIIEKLSTIKKKKYKDEENLQKVMDKEVEAFTDEKIEENVEVGVLETGTGSCEDTAVEVDVLDGGSSEDPEFTIETGNPYDKTEEIIAMINGDSPQANDDIDEDDFLLQAKTSPVNDHTDYDFTLGVVVGMAIASIVFTIIFDFIY